MTTIQTNRGTYTGKTLDSIIRREYGQKAEVLGNNITVPYKYGGSVVLGTVISIDGETVRTH